ncbi:MULTISPECIES: hypothetical protein [Streptomyces]|uniref:hypothetical protein n=1 Tax=Streptomyces TaxID=1883 RepID=UPI001E434A38|nr:MULTISPECIES: hypothetical protein [Streptomyces]UFQ19945.1 hypothetical protein J2N69_36075 [Streptomyces huasconensis]WCL89566.1 hypothetical protein PPN52_36015 [Streptomyces sp. JCM 35825]
MFQTAQQAVQEYRDRALTILLRTDEVEAEARRAYKTEQHRPWFQYHPNGANAVAAPVKAADTARERVAEHLLTTRLEQLREHAAPPTEAAAPTAWTDRLPSSLRAR